jgi:hypothetical protein
MQDKTPGDDAGYEVGYGRPPQHSRFQKGQSGNPAGRRKGVRNLMTDVQRTLRTPVKVTEGDRTRKVSTQEGALRRLREKALQGDPRALDRLIELAIRFNNEPVEMGVALAPDDRAILAAFVTEITTGAKPAATAEAPQDPVPDPAASSDKGIPK